MNEPTGQTNPGQPRTADPGEDMQVRHVHAAIWREESEPYEAARRTPFLLRHFYAILTLWAIYYLIVWAGGWNWNEYEANPLERAKREHVRPTPIPGEAARK